MMSTGLEIRSENMHFRAGFDGVQVRCQLIEVLKISAMRGSLRFEKIT